MRDLFDSAPTPDEIEREALRLWREREMGLPAFVRRMTPDDLDMATGAWAMMLDEATHSLAGGSAVHLTK